MTNTDTYTPRLRTAAVSVQLQFKDSPVWTKVGTITLHYAEAAPGTPIPAGATAMRNVNHEEVGQELIRVGLEILQGAGKTPEVVTDA